MRVVITTVTFLLVGVLVVSLISKLRDRAGTAGLAEAIARMGVLPAGWAHPAALLAVAAEALVTAALLWPGTRATGLAAATLLFGAFTVVLARAVRRRAQVGCHCFGVTATPVGARHVARSGLLGALALGGWAGAVTQPAGAGPGVPGVLFAVAVAGLATAALVLLDDLVWLFRGPDAAP
jgi:hypothetical protein